MTQGTRQHGSGEHGGPTAGSQPEDHISALQSEVLSQPEER